MVRGVDWQWEDQDGGNGRRGKVKLFFLFHHFILEYSMSGDFYLLL